MGQDDRKLVTDVSVWLANVASSVLIIIINKELMTAFKFNFPTCLCGFHFISCAITIWIVEMLGYSQRGAIPFIYAFGFSVVGSISIASANLSLLLNSVGFYQIAKLLLAPTVCLIEVVWLSKRFTIPVFISIAMVLAGVAIVTITDVTVNSLGLSVAIIFVITSAAQVILCGQFQQRFKLSSHQLLSRTSPIQGVLLLLFGPFVDKLVTKQWINSWEANVPGLELIAISCVVAIAVNLSQFLCLGRFSATSFQVLGHAKTVLVLVGGWALFKEVVTLKQALGMSMAVAGMVLYGFFTSHTPKEAPPIVKEPLLEAGAPRRSVKADADSLA